MSTPLHIDIDFVKEAPVLTVNGVRLGPARSVDELQREEMFEKFLADAQQLFAAGKPMDVVARKFMAACAARRGGTEFKVEPATHPEPQGAPARKYKKASPSAKSNGHAR